MIKIILLIILCVIFYYLFKKFEHYQNLNEFYKLNELIDSGDESKKFSFTIEKIEAESATNEFIEASTLNNVDASNVNSINKVEDSHNISTLDSKDLSIELSGSNVFTINFSDNLTLKENNNLIRESSSYELNLTSPGEYHFNCQNDFMVKKQLIINIESDNVVIDGKNILINLSNKRNIKGIFKNGSSNTNGRNNIVIKNMHFIYKSDNDSSFSGSDQSQTQSNNSPNGGGGVCMDYFGRDAKNNVISDCYVYKSDFTANSGGIVGKYAAQKGGELIIMNCVLNGNDMGYLYTNYSSQMRNTGGICGPYLGEDGGKVLVYNCSNYASFMNEGCSGIVGSNAANKNSNVVLFCCSNFGRMSMKDKCSGLVGSNSCKDSSNLSIICCYCLEDDYISYSNTYAPFIGYSSVLNKSNLNIVMCYNSLQIDYQDNVSKYFVAPADLLNQSAENSDGDSSVHSAKQQAQHQRDNESSILMDYCFNSTLSANLNDVEIEKKEFGDNLSNVTVKNCGKIDLTYDGDNSNNIFSSHSDKVMYLGSNYASLFTSVGRSSVNLKQYFDENLQNEKCIYTSNSSSYNVYYRLKNNIIYTSCINDTMILDKYDGQYNSMFSQNVDYKLCKNKSLQNCDKDKCVFKTYYESVRCYPKNVNNNTTYGNPVSLGKQFINCFNLDPMQCQNNQNCKIGPANICVNL